MSNIGPIHQTNPALGQLAAQRAARASAANAPQARGDDSVELSTHARLLSQLADGADVRTDLVDQAKANIEAGVYDRPEVIDATIEAVSEDL